jgi:hypothetical protein
LEFLEAFWEWREARGSSRIRRKEFSGKGEKGMMKIRFGRRELEWPVGIAIGFGMGLLFVALTIFVAVR